VKAHPNRFVALFAAALVSLCLSAGPAAAAASHTVVIDGTSFQSPALTVKVGDSVTWVNKDPFPHTVTSASGGFDSHEIAPGKSWRYIAAKKGEFPYICIFHPTMKGTLRVE
jgi:plastocyanin